MSKDIRPRNNKEQRHGYWERYNSFGFLCYKCFFHNDKEVGYEEYYFNGKLTEKKYYI